MVRLFEQHEIRQTKELDGMWDFTMEGCKKAYRLPVPGCWEQHPDFMRHRGKGTYHKEIYVKQTGHLRLEFKGVSHTADLSFDGTPIAHHYNAYTPFSVIIKDVEKGTHDISVKVDNTFSEDSALHIPNDYYTYGGLTRPVVLETVPDVYIKQVHFTPSCQDGLWNAEIKVTLCNLADRPAAVSADLSLEAYKKNSEEENTRMSLQTELPAACEQTLIWKGSFPHVKAWSGKEPNLYLLKTVLFVDNTPVDDLIERVGFRTVKTEGGQILLNGKPVYLKGFNRHEDYAVDGCAVSLQHMIQDMDLIQATNANALRTCHYPNDERFLDLCDERGIMVWEENHARGLTLEYMQNPNFEKQCEDCIREMIENHYNHPSILIWGILNECASETEDGRRIYKKQYEQIRALDPTRPATSATCRHLTDICLDLPDIVSFNMYSGWYEDCSVSERNDKELAWIRNTGGENKPVIVSEVGAAAIYGYRDLSRCKWSEERQADVIRENLEVYMNDKAITGIFIWQFADCRVTEEGGWFQTRARCHNNKGVVDEYRRPKIAYETVKELFAKYGIS